MEPGMGTLVYAVKDLERAKGLFTQFLGVDPYMDGPYYVGFRVGELEVGLDPHGHAEGPTPYWKVEDIERVLARLLVAGAEIRQPATDVGAGKLTAIVTNPDGIRIGLVQSPRT